MNNITRNRRTGSKRRTLSVAQLSVEEKQLDALTQLLAIQKTQQDTSIERVPDVPRMVLKRDKVYSFCRSAQVLVLNYQTISASGYSLAISLNSFTANSDFTSLFEQYRIAQLTFKFIPQVAFVSSTPVPPLYTWIDQDDDSAPTSLDEGMQKETLRVSPPGQYLERNFIPQLSQDGLVSTNPAVSGYSAPSNNLWVDNVSNNVKYYGIKMWIPQSATLNNVAAYNVVCEAVIQCRRLN